jgi:hypothetical protein
LEVYQSFSEIDPGKIKSMIAGRFFQTQKSCLKQLINICRQDPKSLLLIDIYPTEKAVLQRIFLSSKERRELFSQLSIGHMISVDGPHHLAENIGNFKSANPGLNNELIIHSLDEGNAKDGNIDKLKHLEYLKFEGNDFCWHKKLGYYYPLSGIVVPGNMIGRTIGFPTVNLQIDDKSKILPPMGVYSGWVRIPSGWYRAMINIGIRPTLDLNNVTIEANIFDFDGDLYGQEISLHLYSRIRDELRFPSLTYLKGQLLNDKQKVTGILKRQNIHPGVKDNLILTL